LGHRVAQSPDPVGVQNYPSEIALSGAPPEGGFGSGCDLDSVKPINNEPEQRMKPHERSHPLRRPNKHKNGKSYEKEIFAIRLL
jgi:hypothetical protein